MLTLYARWFSSQWFSGLFGATGVAENSEDPGAETTGGLRLFNDVFISEFWAGYDRSEPSKLILRHSVRFEAEQRVGEAPIGDHLRDGAPIGTVDAHQDCDRLKDSPDASRRVSQILKLCNVSLCDVFQGVLWAALRVLDCELGRSRGFASLCRSGCPARLGLRGSGSGSRLDGLIRDGNTLGSIPDVAVQRNDPLAQAGGAS